jgi:hypothetical protein
MDFPNKPGLVDIEGRRRTSTLGYNRLFKVKWSVKSSAVNVTGVALVAPTSDTHGFNNNQRVVFLEIVSRDEAAKVMTVRTPPVAALAPPQSYMLFLLNGKTYSRARWVRLNA